MPSRNIQDFDPVVTHNGTDTFIYVEGSEGKKTTLNDILDYAYLDMATNLTSTVSQRGIIELATTTQVNAGTDTERAVTPATLALRTATETRTGLIELATQAEVTAGSDTTRAVTPNALLGILTGSTFRASNSQRGTIETATPTEVQDGASDLLAVTPLGLTYRTATTDRTGIIELATQSEANGGSNADRAITPSTLANLDLGNSLLTTGYYLAPGGLLIQWGQTGFLGDIPINDGQDEVVTFPIAFSTVFLCLPGIRDADLADGALAARIRAINTTTVTINVQEWAGRIQNPRVLWIAIGTY